MIKEIEDQEKLEKETREKELEEKVEMPRKTKGICNRLVKPPEFKTKVANFFQQITNLDTDTFIYRKKNYQAGIAIQPNELLEDPLLKPILENKSPPKTPAKNFFLGYLDYEQDNRPYYEDTMN